MSAPAVRPRLVIVDGVPMSALVAEAPEPKAVIVAIHGGGTTAIYFDCPGHPAYSLLQTGAAAGFTVIALDRPDVFLSGDLALRRAIQRAYGFDHLPTEDEVAQVSDRWRPYRSLAVSYLFASEYDA